MLVVAELVRLNPFRAREYLPVHRRHPGRLECKRVRRIPVVRVLPAEGDRRGPGAPAAHVAPVKRARRHALFVDLRLELLGTLDVGPGRLQGPVVAGIPAGAQRRAVHPRPLDVVAILVRLAPRELRRFEFPAPLHPARRDDAEADVRGVQPVVRDGRFGTHLGRGPVHECRRAECRLAGPARIHEGPCTFARLPGIACGKLHEEVVRMLAVDQWRHAVRGFAGRKEQRVTAPAHEWIRAQHGAQHEPVAGSEIAPGRAHHHAGQECLLVAARSFLPVVDAVELHVAHQRPVSALGVSHGVGRRVGLPGGARGIARHRIGAERALHRHRHVVMRVRIARVLGGVVDEGQRRQPKNRDRNHPAILRDGAVQLMVLETTAECSLSRPPES